MTTYRDLKTTFNHGELDPLLDNRPELVAYQNGADKIRNAIVLPHGSARRRPGMVYIDDVPEQLTERDISGDTFTAANGGTTSLLYDDDEDAWMETTTDMDDTNPYDVIEIDMGSDITIKFIDFLNLRLVQASAEPTSSEEFQVHGKEDGGAWEQIGHTIHAVTDPPTGVRGIDRRFSPTKAYRYFKLTRVGDTDLTDTKVRLAEVKMWQESGTLSDSRLIPFIFTNTQSYMMLATEYNIRVYYNDTFAVDIPTPYASEDLSIINWTRRLDTLIIFHPDYQPRQFQRQGDHDEWEPNLYTLKNIPNFAFGDTVYTNGVDEVQDLEFEGAGWTTGRPFTLTLAGETTEPIEYHTTDATLASRIQTALRDLDITSADGITCAAGSGAVDVVVTFSGDDGQQPWGAMAYTDFDITSGTRQLNIYVNTKGVFPGEDVWSTSRGWPRSGAFFQGRLYFAGSKERPGTVWASKAGQVNDFNTAGTLEDRAINVTVDSEESVVFYNILVGRHLQLFASSGEFYVPVSEDNAVTPDNIVIRESTHRGSEEGVRVFEIDGATFFLQRGADALREFLFADVEQAYKSANLSLLASHLVVTTTDMAYRPTTNTEEGDLVLLVNSDGTLATYTTLKDQEVNGWALQETDGTICCVAVDIAEDGATHLPYFVVQRNINGSNVNYLERFGTVTDGINDVLFDSTVSATVGAPTDTITGLDHLEGETVGIIADGSYMGEDTVSSGSLTLVRDIETDYQVGLPFPDVSEDASGYEVWVKVLPSEQQIGKGTLVGKRRRIPRVSAKVQDTTAMTINGSEIAFQSTGTELLDEVITPFDGDKRASGLRGWDYEKAVEIYQTGPFQLTLKAVAYDVTVEAG